MATPMTPDQLLTALRAEGLTVVEYAGWRNRCRCCSGNHKPGGPFVRGWGNVYGTVTHITAGGLGGRSVETYIANIINGDKAVPCKAQFVVAPNGHVYLNSAGRCNHAGTVGGNVKAHLLAADFSTTDDFDNRFTGHAADGNSFTYGIENIAASSMSAEQYDASVKINAAIARHYGWTGQESVGHGEISDQRGKGDPNLDMGRFRRDIMARVSGHRPPVVVAPKPAPAEDPVPTPAPEGLVVETYTQNLAGYDVVHGEATRVARAKGIIPAYINETKDSLWLHFQECAIDMFPELDKRLFGYKRVAEGGKGRESYYRTGQGVKIIEARLRNVTHMLRKDTKEFLVIAWEKDGYRGLDVNFHNENEGSTFQALQLRDVMSVARDTADRLNIPRSNILVTGDSNLKTAAAFARLQGWTEVIYAAAKKIDLNLATTNGWSSRLVPGARIDVDVVQKTADIIEAETHFGKVVSDHWGHRVVRRLKKA